MSLTLALLPLTALLLSAATTRWLILRAAAGWGIFDQPNARSLHSSPIPRTGGVAVLCGGSVPLLAALLLGVDMMTPELLGIGAALVLVASISLLDDVRQVSPVVRLLAHGSAAGLLIFKGLNWSTLELPGLTLALPSLLASGLTLLYVVWMINLYNFMDGLDGFAGGMAVSGFTALALLGGISGDLVFTLIAGSIATAALGFLTGNFPPARIFLGDIGAASLGLLAAGLSLWGKQRGLFPLWAAGLAFSPFIVDATWTLLHRLRRGERLWEAHRSHHYQRLVLAGWSRRATLLRSYVLMTTAAGCAVAAPQLPPAEQWLLLTAWAVIYVLIHWRVMLVERSAISSSLPVVAHCSTDN
jgi:UDP-N-acetylmuramyl pentapeptide phosphotransferase/UDP-N-acetylglucosamine-1-phosphate transferase